MSELVNDLVPARPASVTYVLSVADDPQATSADVAKAIGTDPALAARVLTLANSSYYGLPTRVGRLDLAVSILGFTTVQTVTLLSAAGLDGDVPAGFWEQAALTASAANLLAPLVGAHGPDAFCVGLLHTIGSALLHQRAPLPELCLPFPADGALFLERELACYDVDHAEAGADALRRWRFPSALCDVVADHHAELLPDADPMSRTLYLARLGAHLVLTADEVPLSLLDAVERVSTGRISRYDLGSWTRRIESSAGALQQALTTMVT